MAILAPGGAGGDAREVAASAGLTEQLAPDIARLANGGQMPVFLLLGAEVQQYGWPVRPGRWAAARAP